MGTVFLASLCRYSSGVPGRDHASGRLTRSVALLDTRRELARPAGASSKVCKNGLTSLRILGDNPESAMQIPPDNGEIMTHDEATLRAREIASRVLAPAAGPKNKGGGFSPEAVASLGQSGLLALLLPPALGVPALAPRP